MLRFSLQPKLRVQEARLLPQGTPLVWIQEDEKESSEVGIVLPGTP